MRGSFKEVRAWEGNPKWEKMIERETTLYKRKNDIRTEFERDYTRLIHCNAFRRLKHKTQVFFSPENDHVCTRIEHVIHVESISNTIAKCLGLNMELTQSIATAHDLGHSPFGHQGEKELSRLSKEDLGKPFWHEKNGLDTVEKLELLKDDKNHFQNLNLTYAVRDGIISHCGEIDENAVKPREEAIDFEVYQMPNQYAPFTWEACAVKVADKISYLGRDIEDAITLGILDEHLGELYELLNADSKEVINNTVIINDLIADLVDHSTPETGLCFSDKMLERINKIKKFNYQYIYHSEKLRPSCEYFEIVIRQIYNTLKKVYLEKEKMLKMYPELVEDFYAWLEAYKKGERLEIYENKALFDLSNEKDFYQAILYYIAGMTDNFAMKMYQYVIKI